MASRRKSVTYDTLYFIQRQIIIIYIPGIVRVHALHGPGYRGAGGERGIGGVFATRLAREGANFIVSDRLKNPYPDDSKTWEGLPSLVSKIETTGGPEPIIAQVETLVKAGINRFG